MDVITQYLGWAAWILLLIPLVLVVRLLVRRSRWSILRMTLVSLTGVAVVSFWLHYAEALAGAEPNAYAGVLGSYLAPVLEGWVGGTPLSFFISTALLFLWAGFALMDAVSERNGRKALLLLKQLLESGTYAPLIMSLLVRHVRQLWQAQTLQKQGIRGKALAKPLELNPFIAEKLGRAAMQFPEAVLKRNMLELIDADYFLKTGQAGEEVLEHAVIDLCRGQA